MTNLISLFEAKAHLSELVRQVADSGQSIAISVRGTPKVRVVPCDAPWPAPDAWEVREKVVQEYGQPDFQEPSRDVIDTRSPLDIEDR